MRILKVTANNNRHAFEVETDRSHLAYPYARCENTPTTENPILAVNPEDELGFEAFSFRLSTGEEETVHLDQVLEYNRDPSYMRDLLLYQLTIEAIGGVSASQLSKREIARRLGTSPTQFYRLLDTTNYRKSVDAMLALLQAVDCRVELTVHPLAADKI